MAEAQTLERITAAARQSGARLAGRETPFLRNCWYVAGFAHEFGEALFPRTILGLPLVLYRNKAGAPVALSDRCVHRSFPLSKGARDGDTIICGYHGLRYGTDGRCIEIPGQKGEPNGIAVKSYPLRTQGPLVWVWMGDDAPAESLPLENWVGDAHWPASNQYFHLKANYLALHENLLDLTHLSYLHAGTFGTPDYALAPYKVESDDSTGRFAIMRTVSRTRLPPVWAKPTGLEGRDAARIARSEFVAPSAHVVNVRFEGLHVPEGERPDMQIKTAHLATPETAETTHYFIHHGRNFAQGDASITHFMHEQLCAAFREDVEGLALVEEMVAKSPPEERYEISIASDRAGVAMRRWLLKRVEGEGRL